MTIEPTTESKAKTARPAAKRMVIMVLATGLVLAAERDHEAVLHPAGLDCHRHADERGAAAAWMLRLPYYLTVLCVIIAWDSAYRYFRQSRRTIEKSWG